jgi:aryl-alcohol dehydrogenase-like predicted oxidoreductase
MGSASTSRRAFLAGTAALALATTSRADDEGGGTPAKKPLAKRPFGRTGVEVSAIGLGCFPLGALPKEEDGVALAVRALDGGCTYLDTAPSYSNGQSERRVGLAIRGRPRDSFFLATKTHTRSASAARRDLEESLGRLGVERIDLVQVHAVKDDDDLEAALAPKGPLAALAGAREEGLVRFIGVTGHADPAVVRKTFERWAFDSVLFPMNCVDPHHLSFVKEALPAAVKKGLARVAMKVLASGSLPKQGIDAEQCLRYAVGLDVSVAIVGCANADEVDLALRVGADPRPLTPEETQALLARTLPHRGRIEWYKRS